MQVIVQGAGRGIGLALAKQAVIAGASHLYLTARHPAASAGYREMPPSATIRWFSMDFCDPASVAACGAALCAATPHIDRVISTAGLLHDANIHPEKTITALNTAAMMRAHQPWIISRMVTCVSAPGQGRLALQAKAALLK